MNNSWSYYEEPLYVPAGSGAYVQQRPDLGEKWQYEGNLYKVVYVSPSRVGLAPLVGGGDTLLVALGWLRRTGRRADPLEVLAEGQL